MPPKKILKSSISAPTTNTITAAAYRFHLPALDIPNTSLAEGTQIPAPRRESTPSTSPSETPQTLLSKDQPNPLRSHPTSSHSLSRKFSGDAVSNLNGYNQVSPPQSNNSHTRYAHSKTSHNSTKRSYTPSPASPPQQPSKRPHIRKLLSLKSLASFNRSSSDLSKTSTYSNSGYTVDIRSQSPAPSTNTSTSTLSKLKRRGSDAFWRRHSSFGFGLGLVNEENSDSSIVGDENKAPPMLPELESVGEVPDTEMVKNHKIGHPRIRRQPSGWFGGEKMFDGIGQH